MFPLPLFKRGNRAILATSAGWWDAGASIPAANCIAVYQPKGAADLATSYVNLANPGTYDAAPGTAPDWDTTNGWKFDGATHYLDTSIIPANTWSMIVRFSNFDTSVRAVYPIICGNNNTSGEYSGFYLQVARAAENKHQYSGKGILAVAGENTSGVYCIAYDTGYYNGSSEGTTSTYSQAYPNISIYIGVGHPSSGVPTSFYKGYVQALAIYNTNISASVAALTTAMAAL